MRAPGLRAFVLLCTILAIAAVAQDVGQGPDDPFVQEATGGAGGAGPDVAGNDAGADAGDAGQVLPDGGVATAGDGGLLPDGGVAQAEEQDAGVTQEEVEALRQQVLQQQQQLEAAQAEIEALRERMAVQEELSATSTERALEGYTGVTSAERARRVTQLRTALTTLKLAQEALEAGDEDIGPWVTRAQTELAAAEESTAQWGSQAEARELEEAQRVLALVMPLVANDNLFDAQVAVFDAIRFTASALQMVESARGAGE